MTNCPETAPGRATARVAPTGPRGNRVADTLVVSRLGVRPTQADDAGTGVGTAPARATARVAPTGPGGNRVGDTLAVSRVGVRVPTTRGGNRVGTPLRCLDTGSGNVGDGCEREA